MKYLFLLFVFLATFAAIKTKVPQGAEIGDWSAVAFAVWGIAPKQTENGIRIPSPDRRSLLAVRNWNLTIVRRDQHSANSPAIYFDGIAEVAWASDSSAFFVTRSDGGWVGSWYVRVVRMNDPELRELDVTTQALSEFRQKISRCLDETSNVVAVGWVEGGHKLLLVVESPNHSSCPDMGNIHGYTVEVPSGKIVARYSKELLRSKYGRLFGSRLVDKYRPELR